MEEVERIKYRAVLALRGTWKGKNRHKIYEELGWESSNPALKNYQQAHNQPILETNIHLALFEVEPTHIYHVFRIKRDPVAKYFCSDSMKQFNVVIINFTEIPTLAAFKSHLRAHYRPNLQRIFGVMTQ